ncbi:MAG: quinolinate synthetase [Candidatus Fischerbacteria bacterium RBG_13_37_8]|uniref:Quinolinate synthase n=1 Tax=Candidatus Fischerbacteria bacterium RBG_13_37_8 TaxID=1817863 RepID=A0A1F5VKX2_9BACT|nr:MAG: quinolinate synthetase [Candidatus Fischerbacteria bacterium RBG_13_37_8]
MMEYYQENIPDEYLILKEGQLYERIARAREKLGKSLVILGHHYQRDEVIQFADYTGDSYKLSRLASENTEAKYIVFCGVHFMAESANILAAGGQIVILPDIEAGCSMADMAHIDQVNECWEYLNGIAAGKIIPATYINSSAEIKAFCGKQGGAVCTSSNAAAVFKWAFSHAEKLLFFPDEHLGRNTAYYHLNIPLDEMVVWDPVKVNGGLSREEIEHARIILWKGFCSVHMQFNEQQIKSVRQTYPGIRVIVHPECTFEVVQSADESGSTEHIIKQVSNALDGTKWAVGTEIHLVNRLAKWNPGKLVICLSRISCLCATMFRISPERLLWILENLLQGKVVNRIEVSSEVRSYSKRALDRMLSIT